MLGRGAGWATPWLIVRDEPLSTTSAQGAGMVNNTAGSGNCIGDRKQGTGNRNYTSAIVVAAKAGDPCSME